MIFDFESLQQGRLPLPDQHLQDAKSINRTAFEKMSGLNFIYDFERDADVYNRDAYHYLINMMKMRKELNRLRKEELAHKKMVELFEKHETEYYVNQCKKNIK